jgi:two-component system response regulator HydG
VDVRVISATNHDLKSMVSEGRFREDLLYRLNVATIHVPPLRARKEDLGLLVEHFLARYAEEQGVGTTVPDRFTGGAIRLLVLHDWPGNVRELEHEVTKLAAFARGVEIDERDVRENAGFLAPTTARDGSAPSPVSLEESEIRQIRRALEMSGGNRTRAADLLGINRATLHRKIRRYGIE